MVNQIFISYRREGADVTAKLICEALKNRGYTVFYDFDALKGGFFDSKILNAIQGCNDVILVLPCNGLDRCVNDDDWVRQEISYAIKNKKNIIPVMLNGFEFPASLPEDIDQIRRYNGVRFLMDYFDAVIDKIEERLTSRKSAGVSQNQAAVTSGRLIIKRQMQFSYCMRNIKIFIDDTEVGAISAGKELAFPLPQGIHYIRFNIDWLKKVEQIEISPSHPEAIIEVFFKVGLMNTLDTRIIK